MKKPIVRIYTGAEITDYIDREMNADEYKIYQADQAAELAQRAEAEEKATAKAAILDRIGLTADELKTILG